MRCYSARQAVRRVDNTAARWPQLGYAQTHRQASGAWRRLGILFYVVCFSFKFHSIFIVCFIACCDRSLMIVTLGVVGHVTLCRPAWSIVAPAAHVQNVNRPGMTNNVTAAALNDDDTSI